MSNQNIGISAAMDDKSLLDSIEKTLNGVEGKFTDFAKTIEGQLGDAGNQAGLNLGNGLANGMNSGLNDAKEKARQFRAEISKSLSEGTFSIDDTQTIKNLQIAKDEAKKLYENAAIGSKEFNEMGKTIGDVDVKLKQLNLKNVNLSGAGLSNLASASQPNATNVSDYTSAMAMGTASIQERMDKLKALKDVQRNLSISDADYQSRISAVNKEMSNLKKANQEALASGVQLEKGNNKLMQSFENLGRRVLFYFSLGMLSGFVKQLIDIRAQYEILERSMGALLDDMDRGSQIFNEIKARALKSPFTVLQLASSAKQLIAYDFAENQVVETTSRLADISAALGVPMERLVYNLGQIRAQTVLTARDARDFANAGLPIIKKLSDMYTEQEGKVVSTGEVYSRLTKRMVSFNDVMKVLVGLTNEGGMFYDFQTKQAQTLQGQLSNLTDAYNIFLNELGKSNQGLLTGGITALRSMFNHWKEINTIINTLVYSFGAYWVAQKVINATIGKGNMALNAQILVGKNAAATDLMRKQALMGLNAEELVQLNTTKAATQADYLAVLRKNALTKTQAAWLLIANKGNTTLQAAIAQTGVLTEAETKVALATTKASAVFKLLEVNLISIFKRMGSFIAANWQMLAIMAVIAAISKAVSAFKEHEQKLKEVSDRYKEIQKTVNDTTFDFNVSVKKGDIEEARTKLDELIALAKDKYSIVLSVDTSKMSLAQIQEFYIKLKIQLEKIAAISEDFEKSAADVNLEKPFSKLGDKAQNYFNLISTSVKSIGQQIEQNVKNEGISLTEREKKAVASLNTERQASETQLDYVNRIKKAYDELGLIKQGVSEPEFYQTLLPALGSLGLKVSDYAGVFLNLKKGLDDYGDAAEKANTKFEKFVKDFSKGHNLMGLTPEQRQFLLEPAINTYAAEQNFSDWAKSDFIKYVNKYFKIKIPVEADKPSLLATGKKLDAYRQQLQDYADKNHIVLGVDLQTASQAEMAKSAGSTVDVLRKEIEATKNARDYAKSTGDVISANILQGKIDKDNLELNKALIAAKKEGWADTKEQAKQNKENAKAVKEESDAIKKEIDLINNLNSTYEKLTNSGWKQSDVLDYLKKQYATSADEINKLLAKSGLKQINLNMFKGTMTPDDIIKLLTEQLKTAKGANKINLGVEINKLTVDAAEYDVNKLSEGLQKSINDIKEGYELSLDIQQNPETANLFSNIFGLDLNKLPNTIDKTISQIQAAVNTAISGAKGKNKANLPLLDITKGDVDAWAQSAGLSDDDKNVLVKGLKSVQKTAQDLIKKDFTDTAKAWEQLINKYGEYEAKITEINKTAAEERLTLINKYGTPENKNQANVLRASLAVANTDEQKKAIQEQIKALSAEIANNDSYALKINATIDLSQAKQTAEAQWKQFQESPLYTASFDNLANLSNNTIKLIIQQMDELKGNLSELNPSQLKAFMSAYNQLTEQGQKRNPFATIIEGIKEYIAATRELPIAQKAVTDAKKEEKAATANLEQAQADANTAQSQSNVSSQQQLKIDKNLKKAQEDLTAAKKKTTTAETRLVEVQNDQSKATQKFSKGLSAAQNVLSSTADALNAFTKAFGIDETTKAGKAIASFTTALSAMASVLGVIIALAAVADAALWWVTLIAAALAAIIAGLQVIGGKKDTYTKLTQQIEDLKEVIDDVVDAQKEMLKSMSGNEATAEYDKAKKNIELMIIYYRKLAGEIGSSGGGWGSHSYNYKTNKNLEGYWSAMSALIGKNISKVQDLYNLDAKDLKLIKENMPEAWAKISSKIRDALNNVIDYNDQLSDLEDSLAEALTGISFDDLDSNFSSTLADMSNSAADFASNMETDLKNAIIRAMMTDTYSAKLEEWYKDFQKAMSDSTLTPEEVASLRNQYNDIVSSAIATRNELFKAIGATDTTTTSSLQKGIQNVSETTADAIEGYMNNIMGQSYKHSTQLDTLIAQGEVNMGHSSAILSQLQQSYAIQTAIHAILNNVLSPNGQGLNVYLKS